MDWLEYLRFELPPERIAQRGAEPRDSSRLMAVGKHIAHHIFRELPDLLRPGDLLVFNESKVIPARLAARKPSGGAVEVLLLREEEANLWSAYLRPAKRVRGELLFGEGEGTLHAEVVGQLEDGARLLRFSEDVKPHLERLGRLPLPPYIAPGDSDELWRERYQTVYARVPGSVAAPTAGLHFTPQLLEQLDRMGIGRAHVTLHVGAGTFKPVQGPVAEHVMHAEGFEISPESAAAINRAKAEGRRVVAVGTTVVRALESAWQDGAVQSGAGETRLFIQPGAAFHVPDLLITNFHLPDSTLLLLVAAFAGPERIRAAYQSALETGYHFYSLGDAMLLSRAD